MISRTAPKPEATTCGLHCDEQAFLSLGMLSYNLGHRNR